MAIPLTYNLRNLWARRLTTGLTVGGVALVGFVFAAVLMLAEGVKQTLVSTGSDDNVIITRKSSQSELMSAVSRESAALIETYPEIAVDASNKPVASRDLVVIINLRKKGSGSMGNVTVRGVSPEATSLRPQVQIREGRMFNFGSNEIVVGNAVADEFNGTAIGSKVQIGSGYWTIVGVFDAGKTGFASEIWGDSEQLMIAFNRPVYSSLTVRLKDPADFEALTARITAEQRLQELEPKREKVYYAEQSEFMANFIRAIGLVITVIFSFGAMIGAMITMYAAVSNRTVEIGTLRALGFRRRNILTAFLIEAIILSLAGGTAGLLLASLMEFVRFSTTNFGTFTELAFGFSMSGGIIIGTLMFSLFMGIVGGFLPAVRASRLNIVNALRSN